MTKLSIASLAAITIAFPVAADEVWKTDIGDVVYERDEDEKLKRLLSPEAE